jgi:hypothetical protein
MRRPADVLVDGSSLRGHGATIARIALDVKVINALGLDHLNETTSGPLKAAEAYREKALLHNQTAERCQAQGISYEPLVFTCQGGVERHAEKMISQIADAVAKAEETDACVVKADFLERIGICLARHTARSIFRRGPKQAQQQFHPIQRCLREAADADDALDAGTYGDVGPPAYRDIRLHTSAV